MRAITAEILANKILEAQKIAAESLCTQYLYVRNSRIEIAGIYRSNYAGKVFPGGRVELRGELGEIAYHANNRNQPSPVPFQGETMTCICCGKTRQSDPGISSDWRAVDADGVRYYACPDEFPPDGATALEFELAYTVVFRNIIALRSLTK